MSSVSASIAVLFFALTLSNFFLVRKPRGRAPASQVSLLIPMRNEERNAREIIPTLLAQSELARQEIIVLDDHSTDGTLSALQSFDINVMHGMPLPTGWLGKNFACYQLSQRAVGEFLVFIDADVRLSSIAVTSAIAEMERLQWDFGSPYPRQIAVSFPEILLQPLLQWSWFATVPLRIAERFRLPSMAVANGQFFIVRKDAYEKVGGHQSIASDVIDDIALARTLLRAGFRGGVMEASEIAECHMYQSTSDLIKGYRKSLWHAFGSLWGTGIAISILTLSSLVPWWFAFHGEVLGFVGVIAMVVSRVLVALRTRSRWELAIAHPLAIGALISLILWSWWGKWRGTLTWRDRALA